MPWLVASVVFLPPDLWSIIHPSNEWFIVSAVWKCLLRHGPSIDHSHWPRTGLSDSLGKIQVVGVQTVLAPVTVILPVHTGHGACPDSYTDMQHTYTWKKKCPQVHKRCGRMFDSTWSGFPRPPLGRHFNILHHPLSLPLLLSLCLCYPLRIFYKHK